MARVPKSKFLGKKCTFKLCSEEEDWCGTIVDVIKELDVYFYVVEADTDKKERYSISAEYVVFLAPHKQDLKLVK